MVCKGLCKTSCLMSYIGGINTVEYWKHCFLYTILLRAFEKLRQVIQCRLRPCQILSDNIYTRVRTGSIYTSFLTFSIVPG
ncbi:hypothetical protein RchiOBHm_Chr5g0035801 [Rosa chinensis]|uniref:Uncharacterized protein n=1 Tax=Rosa chinensis TaxID=74649 RepID=A0A2P6QBB6_ROSCH|nr:hypothetical protein RchiOBHm_Chr5g0035801 [Rosa chinensis]